MWKLSRYLVKTTLISVLVVILILLGIDIVFTFIAQMGNVGRGNYTNWTAIAFTLLRLPSDLYLILPVCGFVGTLFGLGSLAAKSELIAMRAAGMSIYRISAAVLIAALVYMIIGLLLSFYISPITRNMAYFKADKAGQPQAAVLVLAHSTWVKAGDHFIYIGQTLPDGKLLDVYDYNTQDNQLISVTHAPTVTVGAQQWTLHSPTITHFSFDGTAVERLPQLTQHSRISTALLRILTLKPENMTVTGLWEYIDYRIKNNLDPQPYQLQLWLRIFQPITILILMLLAVPFVFGPLRSASVGVRLVVGVVIGFAFYIVSQFFGSFSVIYNFTPFWGAALPSILFTILLLILLWRMN